MNKKRTGSSIKTLTVRLPTSLLRETKAKARKQGVSFVSYVENAILQKVERSKAMKEVTPYPPLVSPYTQKVPLREMMKVNLKHGLQLSFQVMPLFDMEKQDQPTQIGLSVRAQVGNVTEFIESTDVRFKDELNAGKKEKQLAALEDFYQIAKARILEG